MHRNAAAPVTGSVHIVDSPFRPCSNGAASEPLSARPASNLFHMGLVRQGAREILPLEKDELEQIGTALQRPVAQQMWNDVMVSLTSTKGRELRVLSGDKVKKAVTGARAFIGHQKKNFTLPTLAAMARSQDIPLEKLDRVQLAAAARYINSAKSTADQIDKASRTLECLHVHTTVGEPPIERSLMTQMLAREAQVPALALKELPLREIQTIFSHVTAALNAGQGRTQIRIGTRTLQLTVGSNGKVSGSSWESPGWFMKIRRILSTRRPM